MELRGYRRANKPQSGLFARQELYSLMKTAKTGCFHAIVPLQQCAL